MPQSTPTRGTERACEVNKDSVKEEACLIETLRFSASLLAAIGYSCTVLWLTWIFIPRTLTDEAINNKVVNLTDVICAAINLAVALFATCYGARVDAKECNPIAFAVSSMIFGVSFVVFSCLVIAGYTSATVSHYAAAMFNISYVINEGEVFNFTKHGFVSRENWVFSQAMGCATLSLSVCLLSISAMACCASRELIWMHTTTKKKKQGDFSPY